ncbi:MAG: alpha-ribazole phosphatase [Bacteroidales bacterium]|nr:alpha-ribazole phosphatase [Bacteroidales bacterium]
MKEIILIRHTKTELPPGICYGNSDVDIDKSFLSHAIAIKTTLDKLSTIKQVYSSPLKRCFKLANYLFDNEINTDNRLKELDFGKWELTAWNILPRTDVENWCTDLDSNAVHGGESFNDLYLRVIEFWKTVAIHQTGSTAIVTHAGVIRAILAYLLEMPKKNAFSINLTYGQMIKVELFDDRNFKITFLNQ